VINVDRLVWFTEYRREFGKLSQEQVEGLEELLSSLSLDLNIDDVRHAAYMFATVKHECGDKWHPVFEKGSRQYFAKYNAGTPIGKRLGNVAATDGYTFRGRGYVQITGRANYEKLGIAIKHNLISDPDVALYPLISYKIMSVGMRKGLFTGKSLEHYIKDDKCDYKNARRIINGLDQADYIAHLAIKFEKIFRISSI